MNSDIKDVLCKAGFPHLTMLAWVKLAAPTIRASGE